MDQDSLLPMFSIGTAARMLDISVHTLRMYEREGLIVPFKSEGNQRLFSKADIHRIECIRQAINEQKMSIEGIKRMHSMIPCWEIIKCSKNDRLHCEAFRSHQFGCWNHEHKDNICAERDCRVCEVYMLSNECGQIKESIIRVTNHEPALTA